MKSKNILYFILVLASIISTGCGSQNNATSLPINTIPPSPSLNTSTAVIVTPSATNSPTQTPTLTLIPTLSTEDALETFTNLIEKDEECNLPCWLEVVPGQTDFDDVENNFLQYSAIAYTEFSSQNAFMRVFFPNFETAIHDTVTEVTPAENGMVSRILVDAAAYQDVNGPINYNNPEFQKLWQRYFVPGIFTRYGAPEKTFLDTTLISADPATNYPYVLWIVYPQQGFFNSLSRE